MARSTDVVDCWDLDHTILNTERKLFWPILMEVARFTGHDLAHVQSVFNEVCATTFSWTNWFMELGLDADMSATLQSHGEDAVIGNIRRCVYPGVIDLIGQRQERGIRQVLVTAGDPAWQRWKFDQLRAMHPLVGVGDRHFVPLHGSKGACIASYRGAARVNFIDDSPRWHREVKALGMIGVRHIRPQWPDTNSTASAPEDGVDWIVTRTIWELTAELEGA